jgi:N-methylhydantoinase A
LVPFGGAGALHACELAAMLGIPQVLVPSHPGILSAYGMAHADWVRDYVTTVLLPEAPATPLRLKKTIDKLKAKAWAEARREGFSRDRVQFKALCDIRYRGQSFEISVPYGNRLKDSFEKAHLRQFSFLHEGHAMEIVNIRLQASVVFSKAMKRESKSQLRHRVLRGADRLRLYWNKKHLEAHIFERDRLFPGGEIRGPAVIAEYSATTFVPPGWEARCDNFLNLRMVQGS